jgi:hypothetical protein
VKALRSYLAASGAQDREAALRLWIAAADPESQLKHLRLLFRGLLFATLESDMHAARSRLIVAWAEAGFPDPPPPALPPISEGNRKYALGVWRQAVARVSLLGLEPVTLVRRTASEQRDRAALRRRAEGAVARQSSDVDRAGAKRAVATFRWTDLVPDEEALPRLNRAADLLEARARGTIELSFAEYPQLVPDQLRASLPFSPLPVEIADDARAARGRRPSVRSAASGNAEKRVAAGSRVAGLRDRRGPQTARSASRRGQVTRCR